MKKSIIIAVFVLLFANSNLFSQEYKSTVTVDAGASLIGAVVRTAIYVFDYSDSDFNYSSIPVFQVTYDYMITDWLSAGVAGAYQYLNFDFQDGSSVKLNRTNIALRGLFHYKVTEKLDMYSGVRTGAIIWSPEGQTTDPTLNEMFDSDYGGSLLRIQLVAFGIRGYFTDNIGANVEFAIGAPYYMMGGINYRF